MNDPWFHLSPLPDEPGAIVQLPPDEARHASGARRLRAGDTLVLADLAGGLARGEVLEGRRGEVRVGLFEFEQRAPAHPALHLASALPKGDRLSALLSMATQLGASSFRPLSCARSVARPSATTPERWQRICREACKQSRRAHLPELLEAATPGEIARIADSSAEPLILFDPAGDWPPDRLLARERVRSASAVHLLVGPEAGFTSRELERVSEAGGLCCALSDGILRCETACAAALALFGPLRARAS